jgi:hypothetical protein
MKSKIICSLCGQRTDVYTVVHKSKPFVDGKNYQKLCFTCFFVPKTLNQTYNSRGLIKEQIELPYSCENLHTPKEIYAEGSSDTLKQAKKSVESVIESCKTCLKANEIKKIKPDWITE